jgi:hypothetical protein
VCKAHGEKKSFLEAIMNLRYLSWEAPGLLCLGAERMTPRFFQRVEGTIHVTPDIAFVGNEAHWQPLQSAQAWPEEIFVREKSGGVFKYLGL